MIIKGFGLNQNTHGAVSFIALSFFISLLNPFGWTMIIFAAPFYFMFILCELNKKKYLIRRSDDILNLSLMAFALYAIFSWLVIGDFDGTLGKVVRHSYEAVIFILITAALLTDSALKFLINAYIYSCMSIVILMVALPHKVANDDTGLRFTLMTIGKEMDPNYLSALFIFPVLIVFYRCLRKKFKFKDIAMLLLLALGVLGMGSRGAFMAIAVGGGIIYIKGQKSIKSIFTSAIVLLIVISIVTLFLSPERINRYDVNTMADGSNLLRFQLWQACWDIFMSDPLWGRGGNAMLALGLQYGAPLNLIAHNTYLTVLADYGLIGMTFFITPYFILILRSVIKKNYVILGISISTLLCSIFISAEDSAFWWQNLMLGYLMLKSNNFENVVLGEKNYVSELAK